MILPGSQASIWLWVPHLTQGDLSWLTLVAVQASIPYVRFLFWQASRPYHEPNFHMTITLSNLSLSLTTCSWWKLYLRRRSQFRIGKDFILIYQYKHLPQSVLIMTGCWDISFDPNLAISNEDNIISKLLDSEARVRHLGLAVFTAKFPESCVSVPLRLEP